jgi:hypothetical protein
MPDSAVSIQGTPVTGMFAVGMPSCVVVSRCGGEGERLGEDGDTVERQGEKWEGKILLLNLAQSPI